MSSDRQYDVVVVGAGGSGLAAAISAAEAGACVVVIEAADRPRGSTGRSVGSIAASGTPDQRRIGVEDSAALHLADYRVLSGALAEREDPALVSLLIDNVTDTMAWLRTLGVEFFGPVGEPPHSVPRLHNVLPGSASYIHHLVKRARRLNVHIEVSTRAEGLVVENGRAAGVEAVQGGVRVDYRATQGVVLASGDFSASSELRRDWISEEVAGFMPVNPYATGAAQRMGESAGGEVLNADVFDVPSMRLAPPASEGLYGLLQRLPPARWVTRPIQWGLRHLPGRLVRSLLMGFVTTYLSPQESMFREGGVLVDARGRFVPTEGQSVNLAVARLGEAGGYLIGDATLFERYSRAPYYVATAPGVAYAYMPDFRRGRKDVFAQADAVPELESALGFDRGALVSALRKARAEGAKVPAKGPYFSLGPLRGYLIQTNGGLRINERLEVLDRSGQPIPGLFAVGNAGQGGLALFGHGHHLGWAFTSGRLAGRAAAGAGVSPGRPAS